jgi:ribonuclease HI
MVDENALNIYTDGSSRNKPRRGGIGVRFIYVNDNGDEAYEDVPLSGYPGATNNEMELKAAILGLEHATAFLEKRPFRKIILYTDSNYIVENYKNAMFLWPKTQWRKQSGAPVLNADLWKDLVRAIRHTGKFVEFTKIKAHSKDQHNKAVDKLARKSADVALNKLLRPRVVRRKHSKNETQPGIVPINGQRLTIRIIQGEYLRVQRVYRYRYEVMSRGNPAFRLVDFICSEIALREGHVYHIRLNSEQENPVIVKLFREVVNRSKQVASPA